MINTPDLWVLLEFKSENKITYKILGAWDGGFLSNDSWRLSSGIISAKQHEKYFELINHSGSIYEVSKSELSYRLNSYTHLIYSSFLKDIKKANANGIDCSMKLLDEASAYDVISKFENGELIQGN